MKKEYRTESCYGSGVRNLAEILEHEICELGNVHIVDEVISSNLADRERLPLGPDGPDEGIGQAIANEIVRKTGRNLTYGLWLAGREEVRALYDGTDGNIDEYEVSDVVVSDCGPDGRLYAYEELPRPTGTA